MNEQPKIQIPFQDFSSPYLELKEELDEAYQRFMKSGWYVLGPEVQGFEEEYAAFCEAEFCVGVGTGLDALRLALEAYGIGEGDEVIVPSNTYIATWLAVTHVGASVVAVEPDETTLNIDPKLIEQAITKKTKAILAVNLYGRPCDYSSIGNIAKTRQIKFITDNAQAQGSKFGDRRVGGIADAECHSFYPSKNLGAYGEAGAVTTNDPEIAERICVLRNYGSRVRYQNEVVGYNNRIDALQAAFLRVKLGKLDEWNEKRAALAKLYYQELESIESIELPHFKAWPDHVWHLMVARSKKRDALRAHLADAGIQTLIHYPTPPHLSEAYRDVKLRSEFPIAKKTANELLSLPLSPFMDTRNVQVVASSIRQFALGLTD